MTALKHSPKFVTNLTFFLIVTLLSASPVFSDEVPPQGQQINGTKTDGTKTDGTKTDGTKTDGTKTEGAKTDGTKTEGAKTEGTKTESATAGATKTEATKTEATKTEAAKTDPAKPPLLTITGTTVIDDEWFKTPSKTGSENQQPNLPLEQCDDYPYQHVLTGTGVVLVDIQKDAEVIQYMASGRRSISLYLNGFLMDTDVPAIITCPTKIRLSYHINPGPKSQKLWISLYQSGFKGATLSEEHPLEVGLGWGGGTGSNSYVVPDANTSHVAITASWRKWFAIGLIAFFSALFIWMMLRTDILRDVPLPSFWEKADKLRRDMPKDTAARTNWLTVNFPGMYNPQNDEQYKKVAHDAVLGILPAQDNDPNTLIGLLLRDPVKSPPRAAFSFARVQLGLWFCFAVLSAVYLWIIYNDLVPIDNSILGLVGLSTGTGIISMVVDKDIPEKSVYFPSKGLFYDLITSAGDDDKPQIYRFQALVVNLLLLFIGILHIGQQLTFPTFDPTWLAFLGISGAAYVTGKKVIEADK